MGCAFPRFSSSSLARRVLQLRLLTRTSRLSRKSAHPAQINCCVQAGRLLAERQGVCRHGPVHGARHMARTHAHIHSLLTRSSHRPPLHRAMWTCVACLARRPSALSHVHVLHEYLYAGLPPLPMGARGYFRVSALTAMQQLCAHPCIAPHNLTHGTLACYFHCRLFLRHPFWAR